MLKEMRLDVKKLTLLYNIDLNKCLEEMKLPFILQLRATLYYNTERRELRMFGLAGLSTASASCHRARGRGGLTASPWH